MRSKTVTAAVLTALAVAGPLVATAAPAAAAGPSQVVAINIPYYNTYFVGDVYWYDRSATVKGTLRGQAGSCRKVFADAYDSTGKIRDHRNTGLVCNAAVVETIPLSMPTVLGGPVKLQVRLDDATPITLAYADCTRTACTTHQVG